MKVISLTYFVLYNMIKKVKLSMCLICDKTMWRSGGIAPQFILSLDAGKQPDSLHGRSTPGEKATITWRIEG